MRLPTFTKTFLSRTQVSNVSLPSTFNFCANGATQNIINMKGMKTGGRKKGTPNKENPIKGFIKTHSLAYFEPKEIVGDDGKKRTMSDFDCDMMMLAPDDRVNAELRLLEFHTPKMKAIDVDMNAQF